MDAAGTHFREKTCGAIIGTTAVTLDDVVEAGWAAAVDSWRALQSVGRLLYVLLYPPVAFLARQFVNLLSNLYDAWIVKGGIQNACVGLYEFHLRLTNRQWMVEASTIALLAASCALRRYLRRTRLGVRFRNWSASRRRKIRRVSATFFS